MTNILISLSFLLLALFGVLIRKTYYQLPVKELKRRAAKHDESAKRLYSVVAYERSLRSLLWIFIALTASVSLVVMSRSIWPWVSVLVVAGVLWLTFSFLPATRVTPYAIKLTVMVSPAILWILSHIHPLLHRGTEKIEERYKKASHTKMFERADLIELIDRQKRQQDSRFTVEELDIAKRALEFSDKPVGEIIIPAKDTKCIKAGDHVGPVLIDEVYKSRQKYVLVREDAKGPFVGILEADKLGLGSEGYVRALMNATVYYLHEDDSLSDALKAFFVTNFPAFVVVNDHEEFVGIATIEEVLRKLMGHIPGDDFSEYSDLSAVANRHNPEKSDKQDPEATTE